MVVQLEPPKIAVEDRTQEIGRELLSSLGESKGRWDDRVMEWAMADPVLKARLFHFIDVLPMLSSTGVVAAHIKSYFADLPQAPAAIRWAARLGRAAAWAARWNATRMARRFIAGENSEEVLASVERMKREGFDFTLDLLGEATVTETEADAYRDEYLHLIETLGPKLKLSLSLKASALYSQFDPIDPEGTFKGVAPRLRAIFRAAIRHGALINIDMEQYAFKGVTLDVFKRLLMEPEFCEWENAGIVIQAYLRDAKSDLEDLHDWVQERGTPVWVRLVKGAYWDYETVIARQSHWPVPVWGQKWESDASYERATEFLMKNHRWLRPAIASHNVRSIAHALAVAELLEVPKGNYEMQMLYGMADGLKQAVRDRGERVRVYTPFGKLLPGMAYLVRRLLENTSNASILRTKPGADLLEKPAPTEEPPAAASTSFTNEPLADFSRYENRRLMQEALVRVRREFGRVYPLWIGGESVATSEYLDSINPANIAELLGKVSKATTDHASQAVAAAQAAFLVWRKTSVEYRTNLLRVIAGMLRERRWELSAWIVFETGKQWRESDAEVAEAIDFCEYYAQEMLALAKPRMRNLPGEENAYFYKPRGVTAVIAPWNFPLAILAGMTVAPLVAGNTVILKPAEQASIVAAKFAEILRDLGLPAGVVNFLLGLGEEVGRSLVEHPDVAAVAFTGSAAVGRGIAVTAARQFTKHAVAEMGGKNAIIIDDDADLDEAVRGVVASAFGYQGQKCSACSRVIVLPRVYDAFVARLTEAVGSLSIGPPEDPAHFIGPVIDLEAFERLRKLSTGSAPSGGYFVAPRVFKDVDPNSMLGQSELFGPILAVIRAKDLSDVSDHSKT